MAVADAIIARAGERLGGLTAARLDYFLWRTAVVEAEAGRLDNFSFHRTRTNSY